MTHDAHEIQAQTPIQSHYDADRIRQDFPILKTRVHGKPLVYLDNAATTQKPQCVLDAVAHYYTQENANVHRGVHHLSQLATERYESARRAVAAFIGARVACEIVFTRGATEGVNLVAHSLGKSLVGPGDEVLVTHMEHHSNIVPWQMLCEEKGARLRVIPMNEDGDLLLAELDRLLNEKTRIIAMTHVSNALGTINPVRDLCARAHEQGALTLVDAAQSVPHMPVNVQELGADFLVFSGHKMYAPMGIGVLYGRAEWLERMRPYQGGGDMILSVSFEKTTFADLPYKFEAGTPNVGGAAGLGAAVNYLNQIGLQSIQAHENDVLAYGLQHLRQVDGLHFIGNPAHRAGVISFTLDGVHPHDIGQVLDNSGIAIRAGHHCAQPVMQFYNVPATARVSLGMYSTRKEMDALVEALQQVREVFAS